jgi:alkanesulfonate monooxygenase SsuD/methylene tetrahydromethanopterin reductase-like flavin-dependent oxidoreductase (luciferase family)
MIIRFGGHIYSARLSTAHPSSPGVPVLVVGGEPYAAHDVALREVDLLVASIEERDEFVRFMEAGAEEDGSIASEPIIPSRRAP